MPRPGPRPYECVRRAWHSDAHQPLRGTLTQEILRVVTELHKPETKCKKEWQEKLPAVVLRAEEILYSKAKSEEEYADPKTLRERLEDAVDTMIRRTDASREDPFMEPCVEAALYLGCCRKSFPRGQRARARHAPGDAKSALAAFSGVASASCTAASSSLSHHHSSFRVPEPSMPGSMHPNSSRPFLHPASIHSEFPPNQEARKIDSPVPAEGAADLSARHPLPCLSSHTTSPQISMPLNGRLSSTAQHDLQLFQPHVRGREVFSNSLLLNTPIFSNKDKQKEAPAALLVEDYSSSAALASLGSVGNLVSLVSCNSKICPSALSIASSSIHCNSGESVLRDLWSEAQEASKMKQVDSPMDQSTSASPLAEYDDLQLRLGPPGGLLPPRMGQGMTTSLSCVTHPLKEVRRFIGKGSEFLQNATNSFNLKMIVGSASSMTPNCQLPSICLNQRSNMSNANSTHVGFQGDIKHMNKETSPATKRRRLSTETFSFSLNAGDSGCSEQSCDLQMGLDLHLQN